MADGWNNDPGRDIAALIGDRGLRERELVELGKQAVDATASSA
jgi:hypothetical protein